MASVVTTTPEGMALEVGLIGREGFSGGLHLLGTGLVSTHCSMQTDGNALRIELATFKTLFDSVPEIRKRALEYIQSKMLTLSQVAGCNHLHAVDQRLARMLLMVLDRSDSNILSLTQELLAEAKRP